MVAATLSGYYTAASASTPNRIYWTCAWAALNFNAAFITCALPSALQYEGYTRVLFIDGISCRIEGAAPGVTITDASVGYPTQGRGMYLEPWTTTAATENHQWNVGCAFNLDSLRASVWAPQLNGITGYAAADDAYMQARGWLETAAAEPLPPTTLIPTPQPVSLEAYRWPLRKVL